MAETRPPPPLVKVCGVQDPESAAGAARAGADLIGMIFVPKSKRCMDVARARAVVDAIGTFRDGGGPAQLALPPLTRLMTAPAWYTSCTAQIRETLSTHRPLVVGVFMDQPVDEVNRLAGEAGIDLVQLHGSEDAEFMRAVTKPVMKVVHVQPDTSVDEVLAAPMITHAGVACAILLDTKVGGASGGTGQTFDWNVACSVQGRGIPVFVAGGLNPNNVAAAVTTVQPLAVDVSSGVESDSSGRKDQELVTAFVNNAKSAAV